MRRKFYPIIEEKVWVMLIPVLNLLEYLIYLGQILSNLNVRLNINMCFVRSSRVRYSMKKEPLETL